MTDSLTRVLDAPRRAMPVLLAFALVAATPHPATAQVYPGDTVRLTVGALEARRGAFVRADTAAIYLRTAGEPLPVRIPFADYTGVDVMLGHRHAAGRAVARGAAVGSGIGAALGLASVLLHPGHGGFGSTVQSLVGGAAAGMALGSGVGATASGFDEEVWKTVDVRRLPTAPVTIAVTDTVPASAGISTARPTRTPGMVAAGDTVRLFVSGTELVRGILVRVDSAGFLVNPMHDPDTVRYGRDSIARAEVRRGDRRRGPIALAKGMAAGTAIGAVFVAMGITANKKSDEGLGVVIGLFFGGVSVAAGTLVGGAVALTYTDQWIPFDPASLRMLPAVM